MNNYVERFVDSVNRFPDRVAVSVRSDAGVERVTYAALDATASRVSARLATRGVGVGDRCAILAGNSAHWCATYLGILRLGAVAVPFDTAYSPSQVATLLADSGARCVIASERYPAAAGAPPGCDVLALEEIVREWAPAVPEQDEPAPGRWECPATLDDPAVILYTSGTTAAPKGVVLTHRNLLAERDGALQIVRVDEQDAVLGVLPLFHSLAQMANLLLPLSVGAHVVFLDTLKTRELLLALEAERISVFCCVPQFFYLIHQRVMAEVASGGLARRTAFHVLLRLSGALRAAGLNIGPWLFGRVHRALGPRMRLLVTGASRFDPAIGHDLHALGFTILQGYGLTETSGAATLTRPGEPIDTVGRPLPGVEIRIASPAAEDIDGEILIRGPIVMAGYWQKPEATAAVLRDGWLYTGDLGRLDRQGRLTITGRSKELIVLSSGKNIYPEEIEAQYRTSPFIRELCVMGVTDTAQPAAERLHAVVVPDADVLREKRIVNVRELLRFEMEGASVSLPPHKRVLGFDVSMDPLPRTTTGKLKRHEILRQYQARVAAKEPPEPGAPDVRGGASEDLAPHLAAMIDAVRDIIAKPIAVVAESNFELDLGLDSLERVELLASLEQRFGVRVPDEQAQRSFTVRDLADAFRDAAHEDVTQRDGAEPSRHSPQGEGGWGTLLRQHTLPIEQQQALRRSRPAAVIAMFVLARVAVALLMRPRVEGREHMPRHGPFILSPNHQSYLDPFVLVGVLPLGVFRQLFFVGASEYFQSRASAWLARQLNVVPVDPDANLLTAMQAGAFGLREGKVLVLFPEGERSIDGTVRAFKKGAGILSEHLQAPIVPVAIDGMFDIWPRSRPLNWKRLVPWSGHRVRITFGAPLAPHEASRLREVVEAMWVAGRRG